MHQLHIATTGRDQQPGTATAPLATLTAARDRLRKMRHAGKLQGGAVVMLHAGTYRLTETFDLTAKDSGTAEAPVVVRAAPDEAVTLSGGLEIEPDVLGPVTDPSVFDCMPTTFELPAYPS